MVIAVGSWQLSLPGCRSLKDKRMVIRSLKDRIRKRYNVSVAETGQQDVWTRGELTVALVAGDRAMADSVLDRLDDFVEDERRVVITGTRRELL
ncbi:MAG: DUF503 domain-containing protein [Gemmatimonadota bacterium]|jgi:uncharacterized protein YlxP (DUF503 family)